MYGSGFNTKILTNSDSFDSGSIYNISNAAKETVFEYPLDDSEDLLPEYIPIESNITTKISPMSKPSEYISFEIISVMPSFGSTLGGTVVVVYGESFKGYKSAFCLFGNTSAPALVLNETALECMTGPVPASGPVSLTLALDGQISLSNVMFSYVTPITVTSMLPARGFTKGGDFIRVNGLGNYFYVSLI
jgi:hypothetical protein